MRITDIIAKKRDGGELTDEEIGFFVHGCCDGIADYQTSAMLMAMYIRGLSARETLALTKAMANSGDKVDLSGIDGIKADKHSTGGVGDKTTLIVAPVIAACGIKMAKMSGRGLGHTGGTVDKLESIPGLRTAIDASEFTSIVNECGLCVIGQSGNLCPADKKLYALRDVTATVDNIPLIASSIMSKKLAAGADIIVLDVKCGSGAFMKTRQDALALADKMVEIGKLAGKKVAALITDMDVPLGHAIGNSLEVIEACDTLRGNGPEDLTQLCLALCGKILSLAGSGSYDECRQMALEAIKSGAALQKFKAMIRLLGGDDSYVDDASLFKKAEFILPITAKSSGFIAHIDTQAVGSACVTLGAGRAKKEDLIDSSAGIIMHKKTGDRVECGDVIAELHCGDKALAHSATQMIEQAVTLSDTQINSNDIILGFAGE